MKTLALCFACATVVGAPAAATTLRIGQTQSRECYESALAKLGTPSAIAVCSAALDDQDLAPNDRVATLVNRGIVLMFGNRPVDASRDFDAALAIDASEPEAYLNKGVNAFRMGNSADAEALANRALELRTHKPALAYYVRGLANEDRGNIKAAYADLQLAHRIEPNWIDPTTELQRYRVTR